MIKTRNSSTGIALVGHLGDVVLYSCVLKPVRELFPNEEIVLIASEPAQQLFARSPYVDRVVHMDAVMFGPWHRLKTPKREGLANRTRRLWAPSLNVDRLILPYHFVMRDHLILINVVARREMIGCVNVPFIGAEYSDLWEKSITHPVDISQQDQTNHVLDNIALFLNQIGCSNITPDRLVVEIATNETERVSARSISKGFGGRPYGMIFPGGSYNRGMKIWPVDRYATVIKNLGRWAPGCWLVCGSVEEQETCESLVERLQSQTPQVQALPVCGVSLPSVAALQKSAQLVLGTDNGGVHMSIACGAPTVSIVGGMLPHRYLPWGDLKIHRTVSYPMDCWGCRYTCTRPSVECIENITPEAVVESCLAVLAVHDRQTSV